MSPGRREEIVAASRRLLESQGEDALTMRNLASEIGVKAPSLYKHVRSRDEIETLLSEQALNEMGSALADAGPSLGDMARAYRRWALENPALYRIATSRPLDRDALTPGTESGAEAPLLELLDGDRDLARAMWSMAHGLVVLELAGRFPEDADLDAAWAAGMAALEAAARR